MMFRGKNEFKKKTPLLLLSHNASVMPGHALWRVPQTLRLPLLGGTMFITNAPDLSTVLPPTLKRRNYQRVQPTVLSGSQLSEKVSKWGSLRLDNPLVAQPCNRVVTWITGDHFLQKYWCHTTISYCIIQILL